MARRSKAKEETAPALATAGSKGQASGSDSGVVSLFKTDIPYHTMSDAELPGPFTLFTTRGLGAYTGALAEYEAPFVVDTPASIDTYNKWLGIESPDTLDVGRFLADTIGRTVTTPGDMSETDIITGLRDYMGHVIDLYACYYTHAALYGATKVAPGARKRGESYLADVGSKPWARSQFQARLADYPVPPGLIRCMEWFYTPLIHPTNGMFIHVWPNASTITSGQGMLDGLAEGANALAQMTDFNEIVSMLKGAGYSGYTPPDALTPVVDAERWDYLVTNSPQRIAVSASVHYQNPCSGNGEQMQFVNQYSTSVPNYAYKGIGTPVWYPDSETDFDAKGFYTTFVDGANYTYGRHYMITDNGQQGQLQCLHFIKGGEWFDPTGGTATSLIASLDFWNELLQPVKGYLQTYSSTAEKRKSWYGARQGYYFLKEFRFLRGPGGVKTLADGGPGWHYDLYQSILKP